MLHRVTFVLGFCATCLFLSTTNAARAQTTTDPSSNVLQVSARESPEFERGLSALNAGDNATAIEAFRAAYESDANPAALMNLGIAYTNSHRPNEAVRALYAYIDHADPVKDAQNLQAVRTEIERMHRDNGVIVLHLLPDFARVELDGVEAKPEQGELLVAPGKRQVNVSAVGYVPFNQALDVQPGRFTLEIELKQVASNTEAQTPAIEPANEPVARPSAEPTDEPESSAAGGCAMSELCVGPVLSLFGPPNLVGGGVHLRFGRYFGAGVDYQALPSITLSPITVGASLLSANARLYPFGGAFFIGGGFAYQSITGQFKDGDSAIAAKAGFPAAMANIGFMGRNGFVLGADIGVLFPLGTNHVNVRDASGKSAQDSASQAELNSSMQDAQSRFTKLLNAMPVFMQVNLIRVGYLF